MRRNTYQIALFSSLLFFLFGTGRINAMVEQLIPTHNYTTNEQLSDNGVTFVFKDSRSHVWVGTYDGLNRFDGYEMKVFKNGLRPDVLASNRVRSMNEDRNGNLWIGTDEGLTIYDYAKDEFRLLYANSQFEEGAIGPIVRHVLVSELGQVYCITQQMEILIFNEDFTLETKLEPNLLGMQNLEAFDAVWLDKTVILIAAQRQLVVFDLEDQLFKEVLPQYTYGLKCVDTDNGVLYMGKEAMIHSFNYQKTEAGYTFEPLNTLNLLPTPESPIWNYTAVTIKADTLGNLWIGTTTRGVYHLKNLDAFNQKQRYSLTKFGTDQDFIRISSIAPNVLGECWIGSFNKGVYRFPSEQNPFRLLAESEGASEHLNSYNIGHVIPYTYNQAMLFTVGGQVAHLNTRSNKVEAFPYDLPEDIQLTTGWIDSRGDTWIASNSGTHDILRYRKEHPKPEVVGRADYPQYSMNNVFILCEDAYGNIWVGDTKEIYKIEVDETGAIQSIASVYSNAFFRSFLPDKIRAMEYDQEYDMLWVGTQSQGLLCLNLKYNPAIRDIPVLGFRKDIRDTASLSSDFITDITILPNNTMWISTEGGGVCQVLNRMSNTQFRVYSEADGLSSNNTKSVIYDGENALWIASNKGLDRLDMRRQSIRSFGKENGLQLSSFTNGGDVLDNGTVILPGKEGLCFFQSSMIKDTDPVPEIRFRDFYVHNQKVRPGDTIRGEVILDNPLAELESVELNYTNNIFALEVISLHYGDVQNHPIRYRLLPQDEDWIEVSSDKQLIQYSGLQSGHYSFEAQAANTGGQWSESISVDVVITPPFWKTWWFKTMVVLVVGLLGYVFYSRRMAGMKQQQERLQERVDAGMAELEKSKKELEINKKEVETQKQAILRRDEEEKEIRFMNQGLAKFGQLLGNQKELDVLCQQLISDLVKYVGAQMGVIYILSDNGADSILQPKGSYACDKDELASEIHIGEGNVGTAFKRGELIEIEDFPDDFIQISSGLGAATPGYMSFIPVLQNENKVGVIELAAFRKMEAYKIEFIQKLGESITASVQLIQFIDQNKLIVDQSTQQAEELRAQEEEMRQTMEEMQATQEELSRMKEMGDIERQELSVQLEEKKAMLTLLQHKITAQEPLSAVLDNASEHIYFKDVEGRYKQCSKSILESMGIADTKLIVGRTEQELMGVKCARDVLALEEKTLTTQEPVRSLIKRNRDDGKSFYEYASVIPAYNSANELMGIWGIRTSIQNGN